MLFVRVCRVPGFHSWLWELRLISSTCFSNLRKFNPKAVVWVRVLEPNSRTALLVLFLLLGPRHTKISLRVSCARAPAEFPCQKLTGRCSTHDPSKIFSHPLFVRSILAFSTALAAKKQEHHGGFCSGPRSSDSDRDAWVFHHRILLFNPTHKLHH